VAFLDLAPKAYLREVIFLVRALRVVLTLVLAAFVVMFTIGVARPETGIYEKVVLVALVVGSIVLAAKFSTWSTRAQSKLRAL
jgi:high-affinity K+ transport system ATPase subunit B